MFVTFLVLFFTLIFTDNFYNNFSQGGIKPGFYHKAQPGGFYEGLDGGGGGSGIHYSLKI